MNIIDQSSQRVQRKAKLVTKKFMRFTFIVFNHELFYQLKICFVFRLRKEKRENERGKMMRVKMKRKMKQWQMKQ